MNRGARISRRRMVGYGLLILLGLVVVVGGYLALVPPNLGALASHPQPVADYAEAAQRVAALQAQEAAEINPACATRLLTHGEKTAKVIVFIHGYTNCPMQFAQLGQQFYDLGYNVLIVRQPHHGLADRQTNDLTNLTADEMVAYGDLLADLAQGLGDHVTIAGLSGGGVIAGWLAQQRSDVDQAVLLNPGFGLKAIPAPATLLVTNLVLLLPDSFSWWDPTHPDYTTGGPMGHAYPRFSLHGLAQQLRLSFAVRALAGRTAPAAPSILVITTGSDLAVDNAASARVVADWQAHGANVSTYEFPAALGLEHDLIDPGQPNQHVDIAYPKLIELIDQ